MNIAADTVVEDIEECVRSGRRPRDDGPYRVKIGNEQLEFHSVIVTDPVPTGRQLVESAEKRPMEEFVVLQLLMSGAVEELRLDETVDLRLGGVEKFVVARADVLYRFELDGHIINWPVTPILGGTLLKLARKDDGFDVILGLADEPDKIIESDEVASLDKTGVERFYTRLKEITIIVNSREKTVTKKELTFDELVALAFENPPSGEFICFTITYRNGPRNKPEGTLIEGKSVKIKEGMIFNVTATDKS